MYVEIFHTNCVLTTKLGQSMISGVASNMVGFVGREKKAVRPEISESMEVDQPAGQRAHYDVDNSTNADHHISGIKPGDTVIHACNTEDAM